MRLATCALVSLFFLAAAPTPSKAEGKPPVPPKPAPWARPRVLARLIYDPPFGPGGGVTVFVRDRWSGSVELFHRGSSGPFTELGVHFWPRARRGTHHDFGIGVGGDVLFTLSSVTGGFGALLLHSIDLHYLARPLEDFGFVIGGKIGVGPTFEARDFGAHARRGSAFDHFGFQMTNYVGLSLGSRRK